MSNFQKNLLIFFCSIIITFILAIPLFKVTATQSSNLVAPTISTQNTKMPSVFSTEIAPSLSLKADIATFSGQILWQSRDATDEAAVTLPQKIQQGESLKTGDNGNISLAFPNTSSLKISPNSEINIAQTIPANLVFAQKSGIIEYSKIAEIAVTVRTLHLLINQNSGDLTITTDTDTNTIIVAIKKGDATLAFNDSDNLTQVFNLNEGHEYIFNDDNRTGITKILK